MFHAIRRAVAGEHELALDAIVLIRAGSVPKTSSGKIQRHACRAAIWRGRWTWWPMARRRAAAEAETVLAGRAAGGTRPEAGRCRRAGSPLGQRQERAGHGRPPHDRLTQLVLEEIRRVAKERANGMTLDSPIVETGMDSLERMEILASLEERFGGRFPRGNPARAGDRPASGRGRGEVPGPRAASGAPPPGDAEIPPAAYRFDQFPEYLQARENLDLLEASGLGNPFFAVHDGSTTDRTTIDGRELINFSSYNYLGMSGDPAVSQAAKEAIDRYGTSASASRLVSGQKALHVELERAVDPLPGHRTTRWPSWAATPRTRR